MIFVPCERLFRLWSWSERARLLSGFFGGLTVKQRIHAFYAKLSNSLK